MRLKQFSAVSAFFAAVTVLACPAEAYVVVGQSISVKPFYIALKPVCNDPDETPEQQFRRVEDLWGRTPGIGDTQALYICTIKAALGGYAPAQVQLGQLYTYSRMLQMGGPIQPMHSDSQAAFYWFQKAADKGDARGAFMTGQMYAFGAGTLQNDALAADFYGRAANAGYGPAEAALENLRTRDKRIAAFDARYAKKAAAKEPAALMACALAYLGGETLRYDAEKGAALARQAAEAGDRDGQSLMGELLIQGLGVQANFNDAIRWLVKAADGGNHTRDYYLISLHDEAGVSEESRGVIEAASARGVLRDVIISSSRLKIVPAGDPDSGSQVTPDMSEVPLKDLKRRAEAGEANAQVNLAIRYMNGDGLPMDINAAKHWFEVAALQNSDAGMNLGDLAYSAQPPDITRAAEAYGLAGLMGDVTGAANAVKLYKSLGQPVKAYAAAISVDRLIALPPTEAVLTLDSMLSFDDRARALLLLNEQKRVHFRSYK